MTEVVTKLHRLWESLLKNFKLPKTRYPRFTQENQQHVPRDDFAEPMVKKKLQPDFGSFSYSIRTDEIKIKNVPTQKLLFREKYFKEQLKNYTYLIVKQKAKAKAKAKSKKQKQKANSKSKCLTNHLLSKKIRLRILLLLNKDR